MIDKLYWKDITKQHEEVVGNNSDQYFAQPARALAFFGGMGVNLFMGYKIITTFM